MLHRDAVTERDLDEIHEYLIEHPDSLVVVDVETNGLNPYRQDAAVVSLSLTVEPDEQTWVLPLAHPDGAWGHEWRDILRVLCNRLVSTRARLVAHNAQFDLRWLGDARLFRQLEWDTMAVAHLLNENESKKLKVLAAPLMGGDWGIDVTNAASVPWFTLAHYNAQDTIATLRLYDQQRTVLDAHPKIAALWQNIVLPAARTLTATTHRGMLLDRDAAVEALSNAREARISAQEGLLAVAAALGMDATGQDTYISWEPTSHWFRQFTTRCTDEGLLQVVEMTPAGQPSWRAGVLTRLARAGAPPAQAILDYRHHTKREQFIQSWLEEADTHGRVHATFNIARTRTGRLSSSEPNLQQVARDLKPLWGAERGWSFVEIDYSQIELRIIAEMIHRTVLPDNPMMEAYQQGLDLHSMNATLVTGGAVEDVTKDQRQAGKAVGFGYCFGMGAVGFMQYAEESYNVLFTLDEARRVRNAYFDTWKGLGEWHDHQMRTARKQGYVTNLFGRRRRLPDVFSDDDRVASHAERQAINAPVQATASDLMLTALGRVEASLPTDQVRIVGTVHDSVLLEVRCDVGEEVVEQVCQLMLTSQVPITVPLEVDVSVGSRWGDATHTFTRRTP
jgi:DNA polymerase-1